MSSNTACPENEKQALLNFKKGLIDAANRLASWDPHHHPDCCRWIGVVCDKRTVHVLSLNLSVPTWDGYTDLESYGMSMLIGEIPKEVTSLQGLQTLNLSRNHLTGKIPESIGSMKSLESLDLSQNQLSSSIPESMSSVTFLSHLNLSFNKLTGIIPTSSQLQGFNESCYAGYHLCGSPLRGCRGSGKELDVRNEAKEISKGQEINWFYISMSLGFVTGFWCVLGPLVISKRWRILYFRFLEAMWWKECDFAGKF
ncbi:hypothetical protein ES288_D10G152300v1 [Gossypium darwinii]|uniref:Leucine-rich repeat-containing N-terminal plant-type domain-containing protein n=1 Tax=Gossypium darwinii TaxID=34276 RepID=A0A5D2AYV6_GOSDA|nr:hypothetical protein ES288_D10G152300v1 [Gossypium darwinii]